VPLIGLGVMVLVKLKYCPECGSLQIKQLAFSQEKCGSCNYTGEMKEGAPDEINAFKQRLKKNPSASEILSRGIKDINKENSVKASMPLAKHYIPPKQDDILDDIEL